MAISRKKASETKSAGFQVLKVSQLVAEALRKRIALGIIKDGDLLPPEPELIEEFGVSRPTLREAIRILETEGLVTTTRGGRKGAQVHYPTPLQSARHAGLALQLRGATISDIFELASILVPPAARIVAEMIPPPDLSELEAIYAALREEQDRPRQIARLLRQFDVTLCTLAGNEAMTLVSQMMAELIELQIETIPASTTDLPRENIEDMAPSLQRLGIVMQALRDHDGPRAEALLAARLRQIQQHHRRVEAQAVPFKMIA